MLSPSSSGFYDCVMKKFLRIPFHVTLELFINHRLDVNLIFLVLPLKSEPWQGNDSDDWGIQEVEGELEKSFYARAH